MTHASAGHTDAGPRPAVPVEVVTIARLPGDVTVDRVQIGRGTRYRVWLRDELMRDYEERGDALVFIHRWIRACDGHPEPLAG